VAEPSAAAPAIYGADGAGSTRNLHEFVVQRLGLMIGTGSIEEGAKILPEVAGDELGVSRGVVREALRVLEAKGMVRPRPRTGTRVCGVQEWDLLDPDVIGWRIRGPHRSKQLSDLMDLRVAVEIIAVRLCCAMATEEDLELLAGHVQRMRDAAREGRNHDFTTADIAFHTQLLLASGNQVFVRFIRPFAAILQAREELDTLPGRVTDETIEQHAEIVDAVRHRDGDRAERTARDMIESSRRELLAHLGLPPR
jgi:DNA-binding FadR family transcriptional regulator